MLAALFLCRASRTITMGMSLLMVSEMPGYVDMIEDLITISLCLSRR